LNQDTRPTVLVVDDVPDNIMVIAGILRSQYRVIFATNGKDALAILNRQSVDLILLDIMMPEMDGYEVCRHLNAAEATRRIPVIFLTAKVATEDEEMGFEVGAVDFIHKPISPPIVAARVRTHLSIKSWQDFLEDKNAWLEQEVGRRLSEINHLQDASIYVMVSLAEFRDECTGNHIRRTQEYVRLLAQHLALHPRDAAALPSDEIELLAKSAPLHDIGKIAIPDHILLKPGKLSVEEFEVMKTHAVRGYEMLKQAGDHMGEHGRFLTTAMAIAHHHHEKWDGSGYPDGLAGSAIPLAARLMAVADVYDALRSSRPYKRAMSLEDTNAFLAQGRGQHFDPDVVDAYFVLASEFADVALRWADPQP
jgi:putative two-component system response regulator